MIPSPSSVLLVGLAVVVLCALLLAVGLLLALRSQRGDVRAARQELEQARAEAAELRQLVETLARRVERPDEGWVITDVGGLETGAERLPRPADTPERIDGRLFADLVLRESVVRAAGLVHGVRRALAPETRDRVRLEVRREIRRSRRQRREDLRELRRARQDRARAQEVA